MKITICKNRPRGRVIHVSSRIDGVEFFVKYNAKITPRMITSDLLKKSDIPWALCGNTIENPDTTLGELVDWYRIKDDVVLTHDGFQVTVITNNYRFRAMYSDDITPSEIFAWRENGRLQHSINGHPMSRTDMKSTLSDLANKYGFGRRLFLCSILITPNV